MARSSARAAPKLNELDRRFFVKKSIKKLSLAKETLRNLNEEQLQDAIGGVKSKNYSDCGSCGIACTVIDCNP